jgi:cyclophilin family peptidyl-prolyl cis-trans isomerase
VRSATLIGTVIALSCVAGACRRSTPPDTLSPPDPRDVFGESIPERLAAQLVTSEGTIHCSIEPHRAPRGSALFVGLARGGFAWRDPNEGRVVRRPLYHHVRFHRGIPNVLVQGGCPLGNGFGHPGYRIPLETNVDDRERLSQRGAVFFATYTPPPMRRDPNPPPAGHVVGSQFVIGLVSMVHLAGHVTVLGTCEDLDVVARIADRREAPPAVLDRVTFE